MQCSESSDSTSWHTAAEVSQDSFELKGTVKKKKKDFNHSGSVLSTQICVCALVSHCKTQHAAADRCWLHASLPTCEEPEGRVSLWAHYFDPAEEGEGDAIGGLGESLDVPAGPGLCVSELTAGKGQDVEVRGAQLSVELLQRPVVRLSLLAVTRHVYNQRRLCMGRERQSVIILEEILLKYIMM